MDSRQFATWSDAQRAMPQRDVKNFTATWGGFSVAPTQQAAYINLGSFVMVFPNTENATSEFSGTSNATSFTMVLPEAIWPSGERACDVLVYDDSAAGGSIGRAVIATDGTVTFHLGIISASRVNWTPNGWTASGVKGWQGSILYAK